VNKEVESDSFFNFFRSLDLSTFADLDDEEKDKADEKMSVD